MSRRLGGIMGYKYKTSSWHLNVDSHVQRTVLATDETTVTQLASHRPLSNAHPASGHEEVPRSTGHIMVTTRYSDQQGSKSRQKKKKKNRYATPQAMAPTNYQNGSAFESFQPCPSILICTPAYQRSRRERDNCTAVAPVTQR